MKFTVLGLTQKILSAMDSDEVNSIGDTVESMQVADTIEMVYNDIVSNIELPEQYVLFQLDPSLDPDKPTVLYIPDVIQNIEWLKYNKIGDVPSTSPSSSTWTTPDGLTIYFGASEATHVSAGSSGGNYEQFKSLTYLPRENFLITVQSFNNLNSNVTSYIIDSEGFNIPLLCRNDKQPEYWTDFSNRIICCDSYDQSLDSTLQSVKTMAYGKKDRVFYMTDNFVIDLDDKYSSILYNQAKAICFSEQKQLIHTQAQQMARRGWIKTQSSKKSVPYGWNATNRLPNYGRRT